MKNKNRKCKNLFLRLLKNKHEKKREKEFKKKKENKK